MALSRVPGDDEIYIGGIFTLRRRATLEETGITHIVSVLRFNFKETEDWEKYQHCSVEVDDVEDENLLGEFARTNDFIGTALKGGGKVLIHCAMGKSRSVTVALAYLLSTRHELNLSSALALIRITRPMAEPNDGFMQQLQLYFDMGCPLDIDAEPAYQRWLYQKEVELSIATGRAPDRFRFEDEENQQGSSSSKSNNTQAMPQKELRCRKCRKTLATGQYLISHLSRPTGTVADSPSNPYEPISALTHSIPNSSSTLPLDDDVADTTAAAAPTKACTHHFIQPLSWMRSTLERGELAGRLECPNLRCGALVGRYAWQGLRCSCGKWVVPGFSLQGGRVDEVRGAGAAGVGAVGIRMPIGAVRKVGADVETGAGRGRGSL